MGTHSNSSLNTFASCMKKYEHSYILKSPTCKPPSPHLIFGSMAHEVLYKAGTLRDASLDGVVEAGEYNTVIPSEILYSELKDEFGIQSWNRYFGYVIKELAKIETKLIKELNEYGDVQIERELKLSITPDEMTKYGYKGIQNSLVGIIDLLLLTKDHAIIIDYKFSTGRKSQSDFDLNSQLPLYAFFVHVKYGVPIRNIKVGYIDIPKQEFGMPTLLSNGTLSRSKSQNVSQEIYKMCVEEIHGKDNDYYNCEPGGYYYDVYCALALNKPAYLSYQYIEEDMYEGTLKDLFDTAKMIEFMTANNMTFLKKYDSYTCKGCEYLLECKKWLTVSGE